MSEKTFCNMEFLKDEEGQELLLKDGTFQVMMEWERPYMQACADSLKPSGDVLEVGFGCGYSASAIQTYKPTSHTIIEYHPVVAEKAREWAKNFSSITIIEATWQEALAALGRFDAIFFDDYPLETASQTEELQSREKALKETLQANKEILSRLNKELPDLPPPSTFSKSDIDEFVDQLKHLVIVEEAYLLNFLHDFEKKGVLSAELTQYALKKLTEKKYLSEKTAQSYRSEKQGPKRTSHDRFFHFFWECFHHHMRKGSRFSCFLEDPTSKFLDDRFLEEIINNPALSFKEKTIQVSPPAHCNYYPHKHALVITIEKMK